MPARGRALLAKNIILGPLASVLADKVYGGYASTKCP